MSTTEILIGVGLTFVLAVGSQVLAADRVEVREYRLGRLTVDIGCQKSTADLAMGS